MMSRIRARVEPADAVLLVMAVGILLFVVSAYHRPAIVGGGFLAYAALIVALVVLPRRWFDE